MRQAKIAPYRANMEVTVRARSGIHHEWEARDETVTRDEEIRRDLERQWRELDGETTSLLLLNPADFADFLDSIKDSAQRNAQAPQRKSSITNSVHLS